MLCHKMTTARTFPQSPDLLASTDSRITIARVACGQCPVQPEHITVANPVAVPRKRLLQHYRLCPNARHSIPVICGVCVYGSTTNKLHGKALSAKHAQHIFCACVEADFLEIDHLDLGF